MTKTPPMTNTHDLRSFIADQMLKAVEGDFDTGRAKAIANFAQQIYNTLNIEFKMARLKAEVPDVVIEAVPFGPVR